MKDYKKIRARGLGIPLEGCCGANNSITDVCGVEVGYSTIITGEPEAATEADSDFARTGVTAILPRGKCRSAVFAGRHDLNGNGELTGCHWIDDSGFLHGPVMITNTNSVGVVRDSTMKWIIKNNFFYPIVKNGAEMKDSFILYPVVGETYDGVLNNVNGFKVKEKHVIEALENAKGGITEEGNVGGGTGMRCHGFKGGTGTASRILSEESGGYTVGVLVQANHGRREHFQIAGIPFGKLIKNCEPVIKGVNLKPGDGSIIVVIATDAPLMPWQLSKLCKRVPIGIGKLGGGYQNGSGDIFIAFSTANKDAFSYTVSNVEMLSDEMINPLYKAVAECVEEAILNALVAAQSMTGKDMNYIPAIPHGQIIEILEKYKELL